VGALVILAAHAFSFASSINAAETRYHGYSKKAKGSGGAVRAVATTRFGGPGAEELIAAGFVAEGNAAGSIVAVGNAWGPAFLDAPGVESPPVVVLGEDRPSADSPFKDAEQKKLDEEFPGKAGFVAVFSPDLRRLVRCVRFGWGAATAGQATFLPDGTVLLSGRCSREFRGWLETSGMGKKLEVVRRPDGAKPDAAKPAGSGGPDLYLARLSPQDGRLLWTVVFEGAEAASAAWERRVGRRPGIHAEPRGGGEIALLAHDRLYAMGLDGGAPRELGPTGGGVLWAVDPKDGSSYVGGDENTNTGREPWRRPFLRKLDRDGKRLWEIWRWDSKLVGSDRYRLVSDSSVRHVVPRPDGDLVVAGWSDGGNSVFNCQPRSLDAPASYKTGFIDSLWGAGVGSFARLMRIDGAGERLEAGTIWCAFLTGKNKPNSLWIDDLTVLEDGRVALAGRSASALVETPDAWTRKFPGGATGAYVAVFDPDLGDLLFSTSLPGVEGRPSIACWGKKAVLAAAIGAGDAARDETSPSESAHQAKPGGALDGFLLLMEI
jgi:hypothetical protein